ncbi:MAG: SurA N-terminal domain-containing protein, partial [Geminicoccaceae bacterium]
MRLVMAQLARLRFGRTQGIALTLACLAMLGQGAWAQQRIAAVVNDEVVSVQDLDDRLDLVMFTSGVDDTPQARQGLTPQVLRGLVEEALQLQEAQRLGITVQDQEMNQALANIAERNNMDLPGMRRLLADAGINFETLLAQIRSQIAWVKVVNQQVRPRVN